MSDVIRLLIVDDETAFLAALQERLSLRGLEVSTAVDGLAALAMCERQAFDVALVDLKLPGMDGRDLLLRLKERCPALEVVILTGHGSLASAVDCTKRGAFSYLPKPYEIEALLTTLHEAYAAGLRRRLEDRQRRLESHYAAVMDAAQNESPLAVLRRIRELDQEEERRKDQNK